MENFLDHPDFYNKAIRTDLSKVSPEDVIRDYCSKFELASVRRHLWRCFIVAVTSNNDMFEGASERDTLFVFITEIERVLEAVIISKQTSR